MLTSARSRKISLARAMAKNGKRRRIIRWTPRGT